MRIIDADAAVGLLKSIGSRDYRREKGTIADAIKMLSHSAYTPTIEAEPVKHGRWVDLPVPVAVYGCSLCKTEIPFGKFPDEMKFCHNCGAKMDLEGNNG